MPGFISGNWDQAGRVRKDGLGGAIGHKGPGKGPEGSKSNLVFSTILEPGQLSLPGRERSFLRPASSRQNLHFLMKFHYSGPRTFNFPKYFLILDQTGGKQVSDERRF